eukprot:8613630-Pyramimonas_sp.AAC.1
MDPRYALSSAEEQLQAARPDLEMLRAKFKHVNAGVVGMRGQLYMKLQSYGLARKKKCPLDSI